MSIFGQRPIAKGCTLSQLANGDYYVKPKFGYSNGPVARQKGFTGTAKFKVAKRGGVDLVECERSASAPLRKQNSPRQYFWIPTIQPSIKFSFGGDPNTLTLTAGFNLLDLGLDPPSATLNYTWDETTVFEVTMTINGAHDFVQTAQADNAFYDDASPFDIVWTDDNEETEILVTIRLDGDVTMAYQALYTYQFALTGSDPISTEVLYQYPNSAFF